MEIAVLNEKEINAINVTADAVIAILRRFPNVIGAGKTFNFSVNEQPDPLRFICEGNEGAYILEIDLEYLRERIDHVDLMCSLLHLQITEQNILPTSDWKCYQYSTAGLVEADSEIPVLHQIPVLHNKVAS